MSTPTILKEGEYLESDIQSLKKDSSFFKDLYKNQLAELFELRNPKLIFDSDFKKKQEEYVNEIVKNGDTLLGNWAYFPWNKTLVHFVKKEQYDLLRTNRNKNIITEEEQEKLSNFTVGLLGLSVGGGIGVNLAYSGISNSMKIADFDTLETTNLNRVRARLDQVEERKIDIVSQQIYEVNPYADLHLFDNGLNESNIVDFISSDPKPNLIFEIIDDFKMKIRIRMEAKKHGVAVIMLTNLGDSVLIDIERYDLDPELEIFNGKIGNIADEILEGEVSKEDEKKYAIGIVGTENLPQKTLESVKLIGEELVGRPQLMSTVSVSGGLAAVLTRKIALGELIKSGRSKLDFGDLI